MTMDLGIFALIVGIIAGILVLTYLAIRAINHLFWKDETIREYAIEEKLQNDAYMWQRQNIKKQMELGYEYNRRLQQSRFDHIKTMAPVLVKQINDGVYEQATNWMKEIQKL